MGAWHALQTRGRARARTRPRPPAHQVSRHGALINHYILLYCELYPSLYMGLIFALFMFLLSQLDSHKLPLLDSYQCMSFSVTLSEESKEVDC